jgi:hypothetical protein
VEFLIHFVHRDFAALKVEFANLQSLQSLQSLQFRWVGKEKGRWGGKRRGSAKRSVGMCGWALC